MKSRKALNLPGYRDLRSNKMEDIQNIFRLLFEELDKQWRLLHQDVATIQLDEDGFLYFGGKDTAGTFRLGRDGADWILDHQAVVGTWDRIRTTKGS